MEAIVLAGGLGTRLRSVVPDLPKPMAPVAGRPFLEIVLGQLARRGFTRVVLSVGYKSELIRAHFGDRFQGLELDYAVEDSPLGTGGAIRLALEHCREDHVFVFNGDTYLDLEVDAVESLWQAHHEAIVVGREVEDVSRYGSLRLEDGRIRVFGEKAGSGRGLINAGCYVLRRDQLDAFQPGQVFSLEVDYLTGLARDAGIRCFVTRGHFIDIGVPEDFQRAQVELAAA